MSTKPRAIVLTGEGLNCEAEANVGFLRAGFESKIVHVRDLLSGKQKLDAHVLHFPGGFLHGDDLGSAKALADLIQATRLDGKPFVDQLTQFVQDGGMVYGACNGFQCLVKLGMLPAFDGRYGEQTATLTFNDSRKFEMRWVKLKVLQSKCPAFQGLEQLELPVRHGEGRFSVYDAFGSVLPSVGEATLLRLFKDGQVLAQYAQKSGPSATSSPTQVYPDNPNGSIQAIAGICDPTGRVFGLMPHPEGYLNFENHPLWHRKADELKRKGEPVPNEGQGMAVFDNLFRYVQENNP
ncbi:phosphoribosylformylglycinamidine synthase subunit PurQ [Candidatus Micrarchaeota archaeon]|nr:phosphoribosylformylglycinamidine synthase subunit PurQ [Candidatus Micrarchaeota archaeon]